MASSPDGRGLNLGQGCRQEQLESAVNVPLTILTTVRFTVDQYQRMIDAGVFAGRDDRIELLQGELAVMSPASAGHDGVIRYLIRWSSKVAGERFDVAVQMGLQLANSESMPEPDVYWIEAGFGRGRPTSMVVPLVIEVALSSAERDYDFKQRLYALDQIQDCWVVDPERETVTVHREPLGDRYAKIQTHQVGATVSPLCLPEAVLDLNWLFRE
jgi:Uma2 family endonuclease